MTTKRKEVDHILWVWGSVPRARGSPAIIVQLELFFVFQLRALEIKQKKWLRPPAKSYKGGYCFDKSNLPSTWTTFLTTPYVFLLLLHPFFIQCKGPQCQLMWLVHLKEVVFTLCIYEDIIWLIENTALTSFYTKWDLRVLTSSAKSMNRECSFVVRAQFWRCQVTRKNLQSW